MVRGIWFGMQLNCDLKLSLTVVLLCFLCSLLSVFVSLERSRVTLLPFFCVKPFCLFFNIHNREITELLGNVPHLIMYQYPCT